MGVFNSIYDSGTVWGLLLALPLSAEGSSRLLSRDVAEDAEGSVPLFSGHCVPLPSATCYCHALPQALSETALAFLWSSLFKEVHRVPLVSGFAEITSVFSFYNGLQILFCDGGVSSARD